jgi:hypothetical protein
MPKARVYALEHNSKLLRSITLQTRVKNGLDPTGEQVVASRAVAKYSLAWTFFKICQSRTELATRTIAQIGYCVKHQHLERQFATGAQTSGLLRAR